MVLYSRQKHVDVGFSPSSPRRTHRLESKVVWGSFSLSSAVIRAFVVAGWP